MASLVSGYEYDIFISYRQKDNKYDGWVTEFVDNLKRELEATFKEEISVYFDINPHDGLLETHDVDASLKEKLKCLVFIPIISRTYCDPKSFAWEHEFRAFIETASHDQFGLKIKLPDGNVASRILPIRIHELDNDDNLLLEKQLGSVLRGIEFIYKESGVNRPLTNYDDEKKNLNKTRYRNQINKVANAIKDIFNGIKGKTKKYVPEQTDTPPLPEENIIQEKSIIVLPFENMSPDPDQEYFCDGITEEIITLLSGVRTLRVISRTSAMMLKGTRKSMKAIGQELDVRYVLEGSVRKSGKNIRITAQLIESQVDKHLWAETFKGILEDIFDIQEAVSRKIVQALRLKLEPEDNENLKRRQLDNVIVYDYYLKASVEITKFSESSINQALRYLQNALDITGDNALLYSGIAFAYWNLVNIGIKHEDYLKNAEEYSIKALSIDPESALAHVILGYIDWFNGNMPGSVPRFKKALEINPNEVFALVGILSVYYSSARISEASHFNDKIMKIDPLSFPSNWSQGAYFFYEGRFNEARLSWQKLYDLYPENPYSQFQYSLILVYCQKIDEAILIFNQNSKENQETVMGKLTLILKFALQGEKDKILQEITHEFRETVLRDCVFSHHLSGFLSLANLKNEALDWLENAVSKGMINYPLLNDIDPFLNNIRGEVRFQKLMDQVKNEWENFKA